MEEAQVTKALVRVPAVGVIWVSSSDCQTTLSGCLSVDGGDSVRGPGHEGLVMRMLSDWFGCRRPTV